MKTLIGAWRLIDACAVDQSGNRFPSPLGPEPMGIAEFGADRMMVVVGDGRPSLPPDAKNRILNAYSGAYRFDGDELLTRVDAASDPALLGTEQVRQVKFDGSRLVVSPKNEILGSAPRSLVLVWERAGQV